MSDPVPFSTPPTPSEINAARRLGISVDDFRRFKRNAAEAARELEAGADPADIPTKPDRYEDDPTKPENYDIRAEQAEYDRMRARPGIFKRRYESPNIFVTAARTPGYVAQMVLMVFCYVVLFFAILLIYGLQKANRVPGIFQAIAMGVLVIPAMILSSLIWRRMGENARNVFRVLVRFWPVTLAGLAFALGSIKLLLR